MINVTEKKENYIPIKRVDAGIQISFGYSDFKYKNEEGNIVTSDTIGTWTEHTFLHERTIRQIKDFILDEMDRRIDQKILSDFKWNDMKIWLSTENQFNYKAAYDLAVQTQGTNLPITFKFGTRDVPVYHTFETLEELNDFYLAAMNFINNTLAEGWKEKDSINWDAYDLNKLEQTE